MRSALIALLLLRTELSVGQGLGDVLDNRGTIAEVFISDVEGFPDTGNRSWKLPCELISQGIKVCLVRNTKCSSNDPQSAETCRIDSIACSRWSKSFDSVDDSLRNLLIINSPLDPRGSFTQVTWEGRNIDYKGLSAKERWQFLQEIFNHYPRLEWNAGARRWVYGELSVESTDSSFTDRLAKWTNASFLNKITVPPVLSEIKSQYPCTDGKLYDVLVRKVDWTIVCPDASETQCQTELVDHISRFAQDEFVSRRSRGEFGQLHARVIPTKDIRAMGQAQRYVNQLCNHKPANGIEKLPLKGGNHFVRDSIVFVGINDLVNLMTCKDWRNLITKDGSQPTMQDIEEWLANVMLPNTALAHPISVVWIGDTLQLSDALRISRNCGIDPYEGKNQPLYHIDLFFHPIGTIGTDHNRFYYYESVLYPSLQRSGKWTPGQKRAFQMLQESLNRTSAYTKCQLTTLGYDPIAVAVPLLIDFEQTSGSLDMYYVSFVNGHSSVTKQQARFLMPSSPRPEYFPSVRYKKALRVARKAARCMGKVDVTLIQGGYGYRYALHCMVKVISRKTD